MGFFKSTNDSSYSQSKCSEYYKETKLLSKSVMPNVMLLLTISDIGPIVFQFQIQVACSI